ncbi:MAG: calcium/sodium antiporter [Lachnospiraceae bacterium]|nr:calcium/sodium antiporter [Lachnospiraceae bacterium]
MIAYIILVVGFVFLIKGADFFVDGAASIAQKLKVPGLIIGMTVVAMGTSAPECAVSITASVRGSNGMAISNVIGSNVFNLLVVCGMCALFSPLVIKKNTLRREFPFSILAAAILLVLGAVGMSVNRVEGVILLIVFAFFLAWMVLSARKVMGREHEAVPAEMKELSNTRCLLYVIGGIAGIVAGGQMVVNSAETIALRFGMSETLVGLTICSIGTSLPELVTSIAAARKNQVDLALGNVIGSNIFNILLVGGLATAISPIAVTRSNLADLGFLIAVSAYILLLVWKRQELRWGGGISMLSIYAAYMVYICVRDTGILPF